MINKLGLSVKVPHVSVAFFWCYPCVFTTTGFFSICITQLNNFAGSEITVQKKVGKAHKKLFIVLFLLFWSPYHEQWLRRVASWRSTCKPYKRVYALNLFASIHYVPQYKIYGTQEAQGRNSVSQRALHPPCPTEMVEVTWGVWAYTPPMSTPENERLGLRGEEPPHTNGARSLRCLHSLLFYHHPQQGTDSN